MYNRSKVIACYTLDEIEALREKYPDVAGELYTADLVKGELGLGKQIYDIFLAYQPSKLSCLQINWPTHEQKIWRRQTF
jgi:hypothetical protein